MQFSVVGSVSTWQRFGVDGDGDGRRSPYDPADAIPAAARYLRASGAPADYRAALFAYNHAEWYVAQVLAKASEYRGVLRQGAGLVLDPGTVHELLANLRVVLTPVQRVDLLAGRIDPQLVTALAASGRRHSVVITALASDHYPGTNHEAGRAVDIGAVDGEICRGGRSGACAQLVRELAAVEGGLRSTELIYCWDPDGPADPRGSRALITVTTSTWDGTRSVGTCVDVVDRIVVVPDDQQRNGRPAEPVVFCGVKLERR